MAGHYMKLKVFHLADQLVLDIYKEIGSLAELVQTYRMYKVSSSHDKLTEGKSLKPEA